MVAADDPKGEAVTTYQQIHKLIHITMSMIEMRKARSGKPPAVAKRAKCRGCKKPHRVSIIRNTEGWTIGKRVNGKVISHRMLPAIGWKYDSEGHFCTKTCATNWANRMIDNAEEKYRLEHPVV